MMPYWIELQELKPNGKEDRMLGSDGTVRLDGRWGFDRAVNFGVEYVMKLRGIKPHITGFKVMKGDRPSNLSFVYSFPMSGGN